MTMLKKSCAWLVLLSLAAGSFTGVTEVNTNVVKAASADAEIVIDGNDVLYAADNVNGLTYKGFGVLSANSTSNLLLDYKTQSPQKYNELLEVLFGGEHPLMNHIKMEMGNDGNNSTGADSCTMRYEDEEADASRSPGFVLAADAKKINPDIKVSILRWEMPKWVQNYWDSNRTGKGFEAVYTWYKETILDAYEKYGYILDYIDPDKNETWSPDTEFIKWFSDRLKNDYDFPDYVPEEVREQYRNTKIIASDENVSLNIVPDMRKDAALYEAVDAIGFHYSTGTTETTSDYVKMADVDDKEVWYSEGCGSFSYTEFHENSTVAYGAGTIGGYQTPVAMCDCMIKSAVYSRKSHYIFQPAIGSFYEGSQYDHKELLSAREPWSGNVHYDQAIYCLAHFFKFAKTGWENEDNTAGIWRIIPQATGNNSDGTEHLRNESGRPSYMTLASPDKKNFSTIAVNNSNKTVSYKIALKDMDMDVDTSLPLELWETTTDSYLQHVDDVVFDGESYCFDVAPFSIVTVTTLKCAGKEEYEKRLPADEMGMVLDTNKDGSAQDTENDILYADDYSYSSYDKNYLASRGMEPRYTVDYSGAFFVEDGRLKQELTQSISQWQGNTPNAVVGDFRWMNYDASVDVTVPGDGYAGLVIREQTGMGYDGSGYSIQITKDGKWTVKKRSNNLASGNVSADPDGTYKLSLTGNGKQITASINGEVVHAYTDDDAEYMGRVRFFSGWNTAYFDNLLIKKIDGAIPYGGAIFDNASDRVSYTGSWDIQTTGSSNDWYRSTSKSGNAGASFIFNIDTDGFALIGENGGNANIDITCDGEKIYSAERTYKSNQHGAFFIAEGLGEGEHEIEVTLKSGSINLDAVMPIGYIPVTVKAINPSESVKQISVGEGYYINPSFVPENVSNRKVYYKADNGDVVSVGNDGWVTGLKEGTAAIYIYAADGSRVQSKCTVTVKNPIIGPGIGNDPTVTPNPNDDTSKDDAANIRAPKIKSAKRAGGKIILKWKKIKGAKGYVIERSVGNKKKFKVIKTIKKNKTIKYVDRKAKKNKKNFYRVKAYIKGGNGKKLFGKYSSIVVVK